MVVGMATTKVTITLPDGQLAEVRNRVRALGSTSVSGYIQQAVQKSLQNAAEFEAMLDQALMETGGPMTAKERAWARKILTPRKNGSRRKNAA